MSSAVAVPQVHNNNALFVDPNNNNCLIDIEKHFIDLGPPIPIKDANDPRLRDIARSGLTEHNTKTGDKLEFERVVCGMTLDVSTCVFGFKVMGETLYVLEVEAKNEDGISKIYEVKVLQLYISGKLVTMLLRLIIKYA